jgi:hypothetical protein
VIAAVMSAYNGTTELKSSPTPADVPAEARATV